MYSLTSLGFGPYFQEQPCDDGAIPARIAGEYKHGYLVWFEYDEGFARLSGRLMRDLSEEARPTVGDWVALKSLPVPDQTAIIEQVLARRSVFTRGAAGRETRRQVIAANVDLVFIVTGLDANYNVHRIQRYVARVRASGAQPLVVLNKADVCDAISAHVSEVEASVPGVQVVATSAVLGHGLESISKLLQPGITAAFVGSSGAGKSTLINAFLGEQKLATGDIRPTDGRGRHTTAGRQMVVAPSGGLLIDTPGMRELALFDDERIDSVFPEIEEMSLRCRFRDCTHQSEPGCAVRQSVDSGVLPPDRFAHYHKMQAEARNYELRLDERERRRTERAVGKQRARDLRLIYRQKEGRLD